MFKHCTLKTLKQVREKLKKTTRWKEIQSSWIGSLHFVKRIILSKLVYRLKQFQSKFQKTSFIKRDKVTPKLIRSCKGPRRAKTNVKEENWTRVNTPRLQWSTEDYRKTLQIHRETGSSVGQNIESRGRSIHTGSTDLTKVKKKNQCKKKAFQRMVLDQLGVCGEKKTDFKI